MQSFLLFYPSVVYLFINNKCNDLTSWFFIRQTNGKITRNVLLPFMLITDTSLILSQILLLLHMQFHLCCPFQDVVLLDDDDTEPARSADFEISNKW